MKTEIVLSLASCNQPPPTKAARRVLEDFTAQINNDHTLCLTGYGYLARL